MTPPLKKTAVGPPERHQPQFDAKAYLERTLPRKPGDTLKVFPMQNRASFRVNWYGSKESLTIMPGLGVFYIRDSKFLFCRLNAEGRPEITYPDQQ